MGGLEKYLPEGIPFPGTRGYAYIAKHSSFTRTWYGYVSKRVASETTRGRVLDVGTGPGYLPIEIAKLTDGLEITGIDVLPDMVRIAKRNAQKAGVTDKIRFEVVDANKMPYEDSHFDIVVSTGSFHHWHKPITVLSEIHRVLKPQGQALIYELRKNAPKEDLEKLKEQYGRLIAPIIYRAVSLHSALTMERLQEILESPENRFKRFSIRSVLPFTMEATLSK